MGSIGADAVVTPLTAEEQMLPVYYINLDSRLDRRQFMERQFAALGIEARRIPGVTPRDPEVVDYAGPLSKPALSCTLSHERAWRTMLASDRAAALILEDDAILSPLLPEFLAAPATAAKAIIRIETENRERRFLPPHQRLSSHIVLRRCKSNEASAAGYTMSAAVARLLLDHPALRRRQIDGVLFYPYLAPALHLDVTFADPALCIQLKATPLRMTELANSNVHGWGSHHEEVAAAMTSDRLGRIWDRVVSDCRKSLDHFGSLRAGLCRHTIPFAGEVATAVLEKSDHPDQEAVGQPGSLTSG
jgi:glycosyl transferase, family 25